MWLEPPVNNNDVAQATKRKKNHNNNVAQATKQKSRAIRK
jgi:hypothetical protein